MSLPGSDNSSGVRVGPDVNALASLIICLVWSCVIAADYFMRRAERQRLLAMQIAERG